MAGCFSMKKTLKVGVDKKDDEKCLLTSYEKNEKDQQQPNLKAEKETKESVEKVKKGEDKNKLDKLKLKTKLKTKKAEKKQKL